MVQGLVVTRSDLRYVSVILTIALCMPIAIGLSSERASAEDPVTFEVGICEDVFSLNPFSGIGPVDSLIFELMYDQLSGVSPEFLPCPRLAQDMVCDETGLVWTISMIEGAYWHDGNLVTADDVAFTYNLILSEPDECAKYFDYLRNVTHVEATGDYVVQITTDVPRGDIPGQRIPILPQHLWSNVPSSQISDVDVFDTNYFPDGPVGSGAFWLQAYYPYDRVVMGGFAYYHGGAPNIDELVIRSFLHEESMINSLAIGEIDLAYDISSSEVWEDAKAYDNVDGQAVSKSVLIELGINCATDDMRDSFPKASDNLETTNLSVRKAIAHAVNRSHIVDSIMDGFADMGETLIPSVDSYWHYDVPSEDEMSFDLDAANAILDAAGYVDIDADGFRENSSSEEPLDFDLYCIYSNEKDVRAAENISAWLGEVGINATVVEVSTPMMWNAWFSCEYDLFIWTWMNWPQDSLDPDFYLQIMTTDMIPTSPIDYTKWSDSYYSNAYYDSLYDLQHSMIDPEERRPIVHEMQAILYDDSPYVVLYYPLDFFAYRDDTFTNYPDMTADPSSSPRYVKFYLEVVSVAEYGNLPPEALVSVGPTEGYLQTVFTFDASGCTDDRDPSDELEVRWDWEADGSYDTSWSVDKVATHQFSYPDVYTVRMQVMDTGGLTNYSTCEVSVLDNVAPVTSVFTDIERNDDGWFMDDVVVTLQSTDDSGEVAFTNYSLDGAVWTMYEAPFSVSGEGAHELQFFSTDWSSNEEEVRTDTIAIDRTDPSLSIELTGTESPEPDVFNSTVDVDLVFSDSVSGISSAEVSVDDGDWETWTASLTIEDEGEHSVEAVVVDGSGRSISASSGFVIDMTAPVTELSMDSIPSDRGWCDSPVTITLDSDDNVTSVAATWYRVDAGGWMEYDGTFLISEEGEHTVEFYSVDVAGNVEEELAVVLMLDATAPQLEISEVGYVDDSAWITYTCSDNMSGVWCSEFSVDGGTFVWMGEDNETVNVEIPDEGTHTITVRVYDMAGNVVSTTYAFTVEFKDSNVLVWTAAAGAALVAGAVVLTLLLLRRKKSP